MNTHPIRSIRSICSRAAWLKAAGVFAFASLLPHDLAHAFAPQDSTHVTRKFAKLSDVANPRGISVVNEMIFYCDSSNARNLRARNFRGELAFNHLDQAARFDKAYSVSPDGRVYYYIESGSTLTSRVAIADSGGNLLGNFGPAGLASGTFGNSIVVAVSPVSGKIYVSDQSGVKGLIRVYDRDGNYIHEFNTTGILASTLEGVNMRILVRGDSQGQDELFIIDRYLVYTAGPTYINGNLKVFGGDGRFRRLVRGGKFEALDNYRFLESMILWNDRLIFSDRNLVSIVPVAVIGGSEILSEFSISRGDSVYGVTDLGELVSVSDGVIQLHGYANFSNFDAVARNAVPNPWVLGIAQRPGGGIVDIDYRVDDLNDATVTTALVGFANGVASLTNVLPLNTLLEGTGSRIGANQPTGTVQRVTWDAGGDWNVDFGTLRVMALARDSRSHWFDTHLVEIPADGARPAVTISRNPLREEDFLAQCFWLVARKDPSVRLVDGVLFGTSGADDGVILANGSTTTPAGKAFLLKRDGLRIATTEEITRAREGATPGFTVQLDPPLQMRRTSPSGTFPNKINEFGIESSPSGTAGTNYWYVVRP